MKSALHIFAATAVLAAGLSACSSPANTSAAATVSAPASATAAPTSTPTPTPTATPTPTPTATPVKKYTSTELAALVGQLRDAGGKKLAVMSSADLSGNVEQAKSMLASMAVEPAACRELAVAGGAPSVEGAAAAMGTSLDAATGASTAIALTSGLDPAFLKKGLVQSAELSKCANMSLAMSGVKVAVTLTRLRGIGSMAGAVAYRTDTELPDGRHQSMITAQAVKRGVLVTVLAAGGASEAEASSRAAKLMDSAAALVK
ncbi:hypothetical protein [Arthrobacter sp. NPDC056727]|uniref:hypothetical protein n=1 Tax=Arthrobacter sp. NPDC056727 TaxID=3345927 RepID=UPI00366E018D